MYELHFRVDIGMSALYRLFRVWNGCVFSMWHFYKLIIWSWGHLSSTSHSLLPSPWRSCFQVTLVLLIIKVSLTVFKNGRKMWHNGRSLEPLCTDMTMLSIFSSLCKKVNKHILQKHCLFNQLKLGLNCVILTLRNLMWNLTSFFIYNLMMQVLLSCNTEYCTS